MARNKNRTPEELEARLVEVAAALKALGDVDSLAAAELLAERAEIENLIEKARLAARRAEYSQRDARVEEARAKLEHTTDEELAEAEAGLHAKTQALMADRAEVERRASKEQRQIQESIDAILAERLRRVLLLAEEPDSLTQKIGV